METEIETREFKAGAGAVVDLTDDPIATGVKSNKRQPLFIVWATAAFHQGKTNVATKGKVNHVGRMEPFFS